MIEFCFLLPWYVFLFIGTFDFGFYAYSLVATANAARVTAMYCAASTSTCSSNTYACTNYAIGQLKFLPNVGSAVTTCNAAPLTVTITYPSIALCPDGNACTSVTVTYVTPQLIPIPNVLLGQITISKTVQMAIM